MWIVKDLHHLEEPPSFAKFVLNNSINMKMCIFQYGHPHLRRAHTLLLLLALLLRNLSPITQSRNHYGSFLTTWMVGQSVSVSPKLKPTVFGCKQRIHCLLDIYEVFFFLKKQKLIT